MSEQFRRNPDAEGWERQAFAMTVEELEVHEAMLAIARLLDGQQVSIGTRRTLERSLRALRSECEGPR